jgi:hypothetical protein
MSENQQTLERLICKINVLKMERITLLNVIRDLSKMLIEKWNKDDK